MYQCIIIYFSSNIYIKKILTRRPFTDRTDSSVLPKLYYLSARGNQRLNIYGFYTIGSMSGQIPTFQVLITHAQEL